MQNIHFLTEEPLAVTATVNPAAPNGANGWYRTNPTVTLRNAAQQAALYPGQVSLDSGATWTTGSATGASTISTQGANTVLYRASDAAGNPGPAGAAPLSLKVDSVRRSSPSRRRPTSRATPPRRPGPARTPTSGIASCAVSAIDTSTPGTRPSPSRRPTTRASPARSRAPTPCSRRRASAARSAAPSRRPCRSRSALRPRSARSHRASPATTPRATTANVISTAGDATLSVADPVPERSRAASSTERSPWPPRLQVGGRPAPVGGQDLHGPDLQRHGDDRLQAVDRRQRPAPHGRLRQDPHVHPLNHHPID